MSLDHSNTSAMLICENQYSDVFVRPVSVVKTDDSPMQVVAINDLSVTHLNLTNLDRHSRYRFSLRGRTETGEGAPIMKEGATILDGGTDQVFIK